uniref:Secreted protein n=1 Tax=Rhodococcus sp. NS1 TaxID=402236 RepID=A0A097SQ22_9NOCA|nr:hypothetical protein LRS1606.185 [Rhodococcus sp. NS1]
MLYRKITFLFPALFGRLSSTTATPCAVVEAPPAGTPLLAGFFVEVTRPFPGRPLHSQRKIMHFGATRWQTRGAGVLCLGQGATDRALRHGDSH